MPARDSRIKKRSATYNAWAAMIQRCRNPENPSFKNYGSRGIAVCVRWMTFENFSKDMGVRPKNRSLDRIDNNGNYEPGNCRWATSVQQRQNTTKTRRFTICGFSGCMSELARHFSINLRTVHNRIDRLGWSVDKAFITPARPRSLR